LNGFGCRYIRHGGSRTARPAFQTERSPAISPRAFQLSMIAVKRRVCARPARLPGCLSGIYKKGLNPHIRDKPRK